MLGLDAETAGHAAQGHGGLLGGARDFQEAGLARVGQEAAGHERAAPCRLDLGDGTIDHFGGQPAHLLLAAVDQTGLQGQGPHIARDQHHIGLDGTVRRLPGQMIDFGLMAESVAQGVPQPLRRIK